MYTLYLSKGSTALAPHILLEEIGCDYRTKEVSIANKDHQSDAYLAINPKGRIPALLTTHGVLTENTAILPYLAQAHPEAGLVPHDPFAFARAQAVNAYISSTVHIAFAHKQRGARWSDDPSAHISMQEKVPENIRQCGQLIEAHYLTGPFVMGDQYTFADPYLFLVQKWMDATNVDVSDFPKICAHRDLMMARPAVQKVMAAHGF